MFVEGFAGGLLLLLGLAALGFALVLGFGLTLILRSMKISERRSWVIGFGSPLVIVGVLFTLAYVLPLLGASSPIDDSNQLTVQLPSAEVVHD